MRVKIILDIYDETKTSVKVCVEDFMTEIDVSDPLIGPPPIQIRHYLYPTGLARQSCDGPLPVGYRFIFYTFIDKG